jgi:hypothetical protein
LPYLEAAGWTGEWARLRTLVNESSRSIASFALNLDLFEGQIGPRIGLECGLPKGSAAADWTPFLDYLVAVGWCLPGKRDGLLRYLASGNGAAGNAAGIERGLHHIKVVLQAGQPLQAKAYLSIVRE